MRKLIENLNRLTEGEGTLFGWQDYKVDAATRLMEKVGKYLQEFLEDHGYEVTRLRQQRGSVWVKFKPGPKTADLEIEAGEALPGELAAQLNIEGALVCSLNNARGFKGIPTRHLGNETASDIASGVLFDFADQLGTHF